MVSAFTETLSDGLLVVATVAIGLIAARGGDPNARRRTHDLRLGVSLRRDLRALMYFVRELPHEVRRHVEHERR